MNYAKEIVLVGSTMETAHEPIIEQRVGIFRNSILVLGRKQNVQTKHMEQV